MQKDKNSVQSFIEDAQLPNPQMEALNLLSQFKYTPNETYTPPKCVLEFCGCRCMPLGDISAISGKAKSGKTAFISFLAEALFGTNPSDQLRATEHRISKIIYFDTEQTDSSVDSVAIKIRKKTNRNDIGNFVDFFNLRKADTNLRIDVIDAFLKQFDNPSSGYSRDFNYVVVIDGLRDLMHDINSTPETTDIINRLLKWTADYPNCAFLVVLHENPRNSDDKMMRGAIGTEIENKMFTNFHIARNKENREVREISIGVSRGEETEDKILFTFGEFGVPVICDSSAIYFTDEDKKTAKERHSKSADNYLAMITQSKHWQKGDLFTRKEFVEFVTDLIGKSERTADNILKCYSGVYWYGSGNGKATTYKYVGDNEEDNEDEENE